MNKQTQKITTGAVVMAIFAVMLILNRQTAGLFEEAFLFLFPIPMVAFSAQYGWKNSLPVLAGMAFFAFLFGNFTTVFYAVTQALIGLIFGDRIFRRTDMTKTVFILMVLSALYNVLNSIVLADLFGVSLDVQIAEMESMMTEMFRSAGLMSGDPAAQASLAVVQSMLTPGFLLQMMVISMVFLGIVQGFLVYVITLLVLRRLRFPVEKPKSVYAFYPPKWSGYLALLCLLGYNMTALRPLPNQMLQNIIRAAGLCGNMYLMIFGIIGILFFARSRFQSKGIGIAICIACFLLISISVLIIGFVYITSDSHRVLYEGNLPPEDSP